MGVKGIFLPYLPYAFNMDVSSTYGTGVVFNRRSLSTYSCFVSDSDRSLNGRVHHTTDICHGPSAILQPFLTSNVIASLSADVIRRVMHMKR